MAQEINQRQGAFQVQQQQSHLLFEQRQLVFQQKQLQQQVRTENLRTDWNIWIVNYIRLDQKSVLTYLNRIWMPTFAQIFQRYPTATITELPAEGDSAAAASFEEEEEAVVEGEDFLSPMADYVGGENYMANVAQVREGSSYHGALWRHDGRPLGGIFSSVPLPRV